ncbi:MAG: hypothetical protein NT124_02795 [Candidatus Dependentiae bacterium]|nr:hypothetical protein [Candidatus Dependentiae bacterium]
MFVRVKKLFGLIGFLSVVNASAYIHKIDVWHKFDTAGNKVQELYCLSDMHSMETLLKPEEVCRLNKIEQEQRVALLSYSEQFKKDNTLFIVEDPQSAADVTHEKIKAYLSVYKPVALAQPDGQKPILLQFLADYLRDHECKVINAECRQQRIVSQQLYSCLVEFRRIQSPLLAQYHTNINTLYGATVKEIVKEFTDSMARVKEYSLSDGSALADYYAATLAKLEKTEPFVNLLNTANCYYWDQLDAISAINKTAFQQAFLVWGLEHLDMHTLHAVYNATDADKVCIVMGSVHVHGVNAVLPQLGYRKIQTIGTEMLTEQEWLSRATYMDKLFNVTQFVPSQKVATWWDYVQNSIQVPVNFAYAMFYGIKFNQLSKKFAYIKPLDTADFGVLVGK